MIDEAVKLATTQASKTSWSDLYISPEAMEDMRSWSVNYNDLLEQSMGNPYLEFRNVLRNVLLYTKYDQPIYAIQKHLTVLIDQRNVRNEHVKMFLQMIQSNQVPGIKGYSAGTDYMVHYDIQNDLEQALRCAVLAEIYGD